MVKVERAATFTLPSFFYPLSVSRFTVLETETTENGQKVRFTAVRVQVTLRHDHNDHCDSTQLFSQHIKCR
jgi:hypothetical protein